MTPDDAAGTDAAAGGEERWYEDDAGSLVRPYTVTQGRTRPSASQTFELMDRVSATGAGEYGRALDHAPAALLDLLAEKARPVVELAADADLPLTVVRVLLGDLVDAGLVRVAPPPVAAEAPSAALLRELIHGLRML